ncbi:MAG: hypothetical protein DWI29_00860 [Planctomycetota bacterium]|nr:MAG: hypothetical protein DWI29_00860 [Planctomycetota bacterium]
MTSNSLFLRSLKFVFTTGSRRRQHRGPRRNGLTTTQPVQVEVVEDRCLLSEIAISPPYVGGGVLAGNPNPQQMNPLTAIPKLNSNPGAPLTIYLDFDGHIETQDWPGVRGDGLTGPVVTPVFDVDNDLTTFSDEELRMIEELWYRMSEDFSLFNFNVTTIDPGTYNDFEAVLVSIGGNGSWLGNAGGVAFLDSFNGGPVNTCYVFTDNTGRGFTDHMKGSALAGSHEVGHTLGLNHNAVYDANGNQTAGYDSGRPDLGPIMGAPYGSARETWSNAPGVVNATTFQDDFAIITGNRNRVVQFRRDDHGNTIQTATPLVVTSPNVSASGILEQNNDIDMFQFETNSGAISFDVRGLDLQSIYPSITNVNRGTNLDLVLSLYNSSGVLIAQSDLATTLDASVSASVTAGTYYVGVSSTGQYGAIGQYALTGIVIPFPSTPTMISPVGTLTQPIPLFEWTIGANADHYELQVDNLTLNLAAYYTRDVIGLSHLAAYQFPEGDYQARVRTIAADDTFSSWSNYVDFTIDIPAPAKPRILRPIGDITESFPTFEWTADVNSSNYNVWVNNATTQQRVIFRTAHAGTTYVHFDPLPDGVYRAWVKAFNTVGESSAWSDFVEFTVDAPIPVAPKVTAPTSVTTNTNPRIVWNAVESAAKYDLWVNHLTTGTGQYIRRENISRLTPYFDPPALAQGSYVAWVRAANGNNEFSPWSTGYSFTVDVLPPVAPKMTGPTGPNGSLTVTTANPTFKWTAVDRAVKYDLWVNNVTTGQAQIIRQQNLTTTQYVALNTLPQGNYRAFVRGINSANEVGEWSATYSFTLDEAIPSIPVITAPVANPAGSVENANPTFAWTAEFDAPFYEFRLDDVTLNKTSVIRVTNIQAKSYTIPNDKRLAEHIYSAMVRGVNSSGEMSNWSVPYRVRIDVPNPATPTIISPSGTAKDTTPTFQWSHDPAAFRYEILVRDLERNETIVLQVRTFAVDPTGKISFYTLPDNQALRVGTYRFWIRAFNSLGTSSSWSNSQTFVISASLDLKDLKLVEPAKLLSAEEYYAVVETGVEPESEAAEVGTVETSPFTMSVTEPALPPVTDAEMPLAAIEELMESLADPSSVASTMMSGSLFIDSTTESRTTKTSTAAASILALAMLPVRRKRREA